MTLADTPTTWPTGPSVSTLSLLAIFVGVPLAVIGAAFLLTYAPSWARGPRYRPGQPWEARTEWFGTAVPEDTAASADRPTVPAVPAGASTAARRGDPGRLGARGVDRRPAPDPAAPGGGAAPAGASEPAVTLDSVDAEAGGASARW